MIYPKYLLVIGILVLVVFGGSYAVIYSGTKNLREICANISPTSTADEIRRLGDKPGVKLREVDVVTGAIVFIIEPTERTIGKLECVIRYENGRIVDAKIEASH